MGGGETLFGRIIRGADTDNLKRPGVDALIEDVGITREIDLRDEVSGQGGPGSLLAQRVEDRHQISVYEQGEVAATMKRLTTEYDWDQVGEYTMALSESSGIVSVLALLADDSGQLVEVKPPAIGESVDIKAAQPQSPFDI